MLVTLTSKNQMYLFFCWVSCRLQNYLEWKWLKSVSGACVKFTLELHPETPNLFNGCLLTLLYCCVKYTIRIMLNYYITTDYTNQCKRNVCKKADSPSISTRILMVRSAHTANIAHKKNPPTQLSDCNPKRNTMFHSTSANSVSNTYI